MNGSFVFVSGEANFIHKVRNRILTEKERHNKSAHTRTHKTTVWSPATNGNESLNEICL